ncbi:MAG: DUF4367 domain-containing protein [Oliverpabstia sp.]
MKKNDKIQDSPEFKYLEANFSDFVKEMEEDKESADLKLPDGWEQDFARTIDETLDGNERRRRRKIVKRIAGVAAAAVLVLVVGNFTAESVSGEGLLEMFMNVLHLDSNQHMIYGNGNEMEINSDDEEDVFFLGSDILEVNDQIRQEIKKPMLYLNYIPEGFDIVEARYNHMFRITNVKLMKDKDYIYFFQQQQIEETAVGISSEEEEVAVIFNKKLNQEIHIHKNMQDSYLTFCVNYNESIITVNAFVSLEECEKMAESIDYK